jgi:hypothetical protein
LTYLILKTGNSGRSPLVPYFNSPYWQDFEEVLEKNRYRNMLMNEIKSNYRVHFYQGFFHPQREETNALIDDAEYRTDIAKRIEEQRHQTAILCVTLGLYKDTYEAKQGVRGKFICDKLTYVGRQDDREVRLQVQTPFIQIMNVIIVNKS